MSWHERVRNAFHDPAGVIVELEISDDTVDDQPIGIVSLSFRVKDLRGEPYVARARLLLPAAVLDGQADVPVWFSCGYELTDVPAARQLRRGRVVVTSCDPVGEEVFPFHNPLCRGPNTDYVLAHLVRGLTFVDPTRIVYAGGSAGGYAALLVAAEAFPAAAAVPSSPVVNLVYQAAHLMDNAPRLAAEPPAEQPLMGVLMGMFLPFIDRGWSRAFGDDLSATAWWDHSPMAHVDEVSCPVAAFFSTGDFLVPIEQVGSEVAAATLAELPPGVVMAAADLSPLSTASVRLLEVLGERADLRVVPVPEGAATASISDIDLTMSRPQTPVAVPVDGQAQWQVVVVDEGPTVFGIGHTRHLIEPDFDAFVDLALTTGVAVEQLTADKLRQLLRRWRGEEWLARGFHHLDELAAERADVEVGLRAYCAVSPAHAERFASLYAQVGGGELPQALLGELTP